MLRKMNERRKAVISMIQLLNGDTSFTLLQALKRSDPYTDYMVAKEKSKYDDYDGSEGCIHLFNRSIKKHPTSFAYFHLAQSKKCQLFKGFCWNFITCPYWLQEQILG
jgi:hypothetical protein